MDNPSTPAAVPVDLPQLPSNDELRKIARAARFSSSDPGSPVEFVIAGWRAALALPPAGEGEATVPSADECAMVINLLVAGGFVKPEKVQEAIRIASDVLGDRIGQPVGAGEQPSEAPYEEDHKANARYFEVPAGTVGEPATPNGAAHVFKQPGWDHVFAAFIEGAREAYFNPTANDEDFRRAADGYTKRIHEEVDPESERRLRENDWPASPTVAGNDVHKVESTGTPSGAAGEGLEWRMVPALATAAMCDAGVKRMFEDRHYACAWEDVFFNIYKTMLAAAPSPKDTP